MGSRIGYKKGLAPGLPFGNCGKLGEGIGVPHRHIGEHLAVDLNPRLPQAIDESAIGEPLLPGGGIDAYNPQPPEIALSLAAVTIGVAQGLHHRLMGDAIVGMPHPTLSLGQLQHLLMATAGYNPTFYPGQLHPPFRPLLLPLCGEKLAV